MIEGLSGPFANTGEAVYRNLVWATERVNARGGVKLPGGNRPLLIERFDSKGQTEEALSALRSAIDRDITVVTQGNSSAAASSALIDAINKHNERDPARQVLFLNYSAVDPGSHQPELQLLAFPFRRPRRHAHDRADERVARRQGQLKQHLPDRPGLQLRPVGAA